MSGDVSGAPRLLLRIEGASLLVCALAGYAWAVGPIVGGLVLMGIARIIMLLGAINRSLRGQV